MLMLQCLTANHFDVLETLMNTVQIRGKGTITIPIKFRTKYKMRKGNVFTFIDLGKKIFLLKPNILKVDVVSRRISKGIKNDGISSNDLFQTLDKERKLYFEENYGTEE